MSEKKTTVTVTYPGPAVKGQARLDAQYFMAPGVHLKLGANEVEPEMADTLRAAGIVMPAPATVSSTPVPLDEPRRKRPRLSDDEKPAEKEKE